MAGRYTDEERRARGQYQDETGQWYTKSGYAITEGGQSVRSEPPAPATEQPAQAVQPAQTAQTALAGRYDFYDAQMRREQQSQAESELQQQAGEAAVRLLKDRRAAAALAAERAVRQAYIAHMSDQRALAQRLAAQGASGGMTDTAYLRLLADYENRRGELLSQRDSDLLAIDRAIDASRIETAQTVLKAQQKEAEEARRLAEEEEARRLAEEEAAQRQAARTGIAASSKSAAKRASEEKEASAQKKTAAKAEHVSDPAQRLKDEYSRIEEALYAGTLTQAQARSLKNIYARIYRTGE